MHCWWKANACSRSSPVTDELGFVLVPRFPGISICTRVPWSLEAFTITRTCSTCCRDWFHRRSDRNRTPSSFDMPNNQGHSPTLPRGHVIGKHRFDHSIRSWGRQITALMSFLWRTDCTRSLWASWCALTPATTTKIQLCSRTRWITSDFLLRAKGHRVSTWRCLVKYHPACGSSLGRFANRCYDRSECGVGSGSASTKGVVKIAHKRQMGGFVCSCVLWKALDVDISTCCSRHENHCEIWIH